MRWAQSLRRWTMRGLHALVLGGAFLGTASYGVAQVPSAAAANLPRQDFTSKRSFALPVKLDAAQQMKLKEIRLYVKAPSGEWKLHESIPPNLTKFECKVQQDGEYWFLLALVDRADKMEPANLQVEPPSRRVVVDTTAPVINVEPWTSPEGDFCLRCNVVDANPDHQSLKAVFKTPTGEVPLERVANQQATFRVKRTDLTQHPVVISVRDLAGNVGTKEVNVSEMLRTSLKNMPETPPQIAGQPRTETPEGPVPLPAPRFDAAPGALPIAGMPTAKNEVPAPTPVAAAGALAPIDPPANNVTANRLPPSASEPTHHGDVPHQLINTTRANVDFRIDQVGPSGVGKVEIYLTADKGHSWRRIGEVIDKRSPTEINLPGDGEFGIRIAVTNGNGFGGRAPVKGDVPHCTIEVDTLAPIVQLRSTEVIPSSGHVEIRWNAQDKNLGTEPVSLFYSTKAEGPWQVIARNVKNDGVHRWTFPRDAGSQFFFKIEVTDQAGNLTQELSRQPLLIDITEPRASVVGITGGSNIRQTGN